ncbi:hypothetical protein ANN_22324 [Periplaneta americana]|uniref:Endonuclease/exonuclease/phosphatase domain-containing protein n=1 Tax=Periplaneta americana TaxID=6978 RepID=A0ABQ8S8B6_PERAM|nr:hypothetical protein ANN_22324 [Periplaneta americana]
MVEFISDRLSHLVLKGSWCDIVVINAHAPTEKKDDHIKDSFYEELEQTFDQLPRYHMKILLGDFNAKVGREDIFKQTIGKESLHVTSNDNGVRLVNFVTSKNLIFSGFQGGDPPKLLALSTGLHGLYSSDDGYLLQRNPGQTFSGEDFRLGPLRQPWGGGVAEVGVVNGLCIKVIDVRTSETKKQQSQNGCTYGRVYHCRVLRYAILLDKISDSKGYS